MSILYLLCGPSGSGKSTFVKNSGLNACWVSRDTIRFALLGEDDEYFAKEKEVYRNFVKIIQEDLSEGKDVIADATHINWASRRKLLNKLKLDGVSVIAVNFKTSLGVCLKRNDLREGRACVPDEVIVQQFKHFHPANFGEFEYNAIYNVDKNGEIIYE